MVRLVYFLGFIMVSTSLFSQNIWKDYEELFYPVQNYVIYKAGESINVDGLADEEVWSKAKWTNYFRDIEGDKKPVPAYKTRCKMLWDEENLYIYAELEEPHVWAYYDKKDMIVYHENDFEVFIDPDRSTHKYYEFEVNARNTLFDLYMDKPYRNGGKANIKWDAKGFKSAVFVNGTLNDPNDKDKMWTVEMSIPFSSLTLDKEFVLPQDGDVWKLGFSRVQWQTELVEGKYHRKKDKSGKNLPEDNWVWSPQGVINMHFPERWGMALFSDTLAGTGIVQFKTPEEEIYAKYLWLLYYKQKAYKKEYGKYAQDIKDLGLEKITGPDGKVITYTMEVSDNSFQYMIKPKNNFKLTINQDGWIKKSTNN